MEQDALEVDWASIEEELYGYSDVWKNPKFDSLPQVVKVLSDKNPQSALESLKKQRDGVEELINDVVSAYHVGFNKAIHNYSEILRLFGSSSSEISGLDSRLNGAKKLLNAKHKHLQQLWYRSMTLRNIISLMDHLDAISKVPEKIEVYISSKKLYAAIQLLLQTQNIIEREGLQNVGGLREIKNELKSLQSTIFYKVVDELNDHIYNQGEFSVSNVKSEENDDDINEIAVATVPSSAPLHPSLVNSSAFSSSSSTPSALSKYKAKSMRRMAVDSKSDSKSMAGDMSGIDELNEDFPTTPSSEKSSASLEVDNFYLKKKLLPPSWLADATSNEFVENMSKSDSPQHIKYLQTMVEILFLLKKISAAGAILCHRLRGKVREIIISEIKLRVSDLDITRPRLEQVNQNVVFSPTKKKTAVLLNNDNMIYSPAKSSAKKHYSKKNATFDILESDNDKYNAYGNSQLSKSQRNVHALLDSIFAVLGKILENHIVVGECIESKIVKSEEYTSFYNDKQNIESNIFNGGYNVGYAWTCIQNECQQLICDILRASPDGSSLDSNLKNLKVSNTVGDDELTFSFRFSDTANTASPGGMVAGVLGGDGLFHSQRKKQNLNQNENYGTSLLIAEKGIYLTSACYRPIIQFTEKIHSMLPTNYVDNHLRGFIDNFVKEQFLPNVRNDYRSKVADALSSPTSFKPKKRNISNFEKGFENERTILNSLLTVENLVGEVLNWTRSMPNFATEFVVLIQALLEKTLEKCKAFFTESVLGALSIALVSRQDLDNLMQKQNSINLLKGNFNDENFRKVMDENSLETENDEIDMEIFNMLYSLFPIKEEQLIFDSHKLIEISALSDSLDHMANFIYELGQADSFVSHQRSSAKKKLQHRRTPSTVALSTGLGRLSEKYRSLSLECMRTLRVELLLQSIFHLYCMTQRSYINDVDAEDAEDFIVALNSQITRIHEDISFYLPVSRINYAFGGICNISANCIIKVLEELEAINSLGVRQIQRNCIALQQTLGSLGVNSSQNVQSTFDRVAEYYELLNRPYEALLGYVKEHTHFFTFEEYTALFTVTVPGRAIPPDAIVKMKKLLTS